ncbi:MAG: uL15 family ribosomal protein [Bacilli bacterium]|jgi:hypothetical protein
MFPFLAIQVTHIIGIIIAAVIIFGITIYFITDKYKNKKFIEDIEKRKEAQRLEEEEREALVAEYRKSKKSGEEFLDEEAKEQAISKAEKRRPVITALIQNVVPIEDSVKLSDEDEEKLVVVVKDTKVYSQKMKEVVVTTTQLGVFEDGDIVNPLTLIEKGIISKYGHYYLKIQAKGPIKKALNVEAHDYDNYAAKMILLAGGTVIKVTK